MEMLNPIDALKKQAAEKAVESVQSGMIVGLGHGSTAIWMTRRIAELLKSGELKNVLGIPCSLHVESEAKALGIPLTTLDEHPAVDVVIDGADEIDPQMNLIKGGGGALLREKIVAQAGAVRIIIADDSKLSDKLGMQWAVPVEVIPFGAVTVKRFLEELGAAATLRSKADGEAFVTDQGNFFLDANFGAMDNPFAIARAMEGKAGIVEHGLFLDIADRVIIAGKDGVFEMGVA